MLHFYYYKVYACFSLTILRTSNSRMRIIKTATRKIPYTHHTHTKLATAVGEHAPGKKVSWPHAWIFSFWQGHTVCERWGLNTSSLPFYDWSNQFIFIIKILKQNMRLLKSLGWPSCLIITLFLSCFRVFDGYRPQPTNSARKDKVLMRSKFNPGWTT